MTGNFHTKPIILDGEYYQVSIPTNSLYTNIIEKAPPHNPDFRWKDSGYMLLHWRTEECAVIMSSHNMRPVYTITPPFNHGSAVNPGLNEWFFRPVLIPLDRYQQYTPEMKTQYKNGELVSFGTFHYSNGIYQPGNLPERYDSPDWGWLPWFDDSDGQHDLRWMVWDGILVCCDDLLVCTPDYLFDNYFIADYKE